MIGTGVDASHADLKAHVGRGADLGNGSTVDGTPDQGTAQVAGIIAGTGRNHNGDGLYGLTPEARVLPAHVDRNDQLLTSGTAKAIHQAPSRALRDALCLARQSRVLPSSGSGGPHGPRHRTRREHAGQHT
jgi:subtilisin family serine protease